MTNQPFITTLREEWSKYVTKLILASPERPLLHYTEIIADFWLQKMSEHKERLIKEVSGLKKETTFANGKKLPHYKWKAVKEFNQALEDILRRLQSV